MMGNKKYSSGKRSKKIKTLSSGETAPDVPKDIITEILVRLPAKTLLKFRCVAKSWLALISSPSFVRAHSTFSTLDPTLSGYRFLLGVSFSLNQQKLGCVRSVLLRDVLNDAVGVGHGHSRDTRHHINGSCNGLLCVSTHSRRGKGYVCLWNPCLRMSKKLPPMQSAGSKDVSMPMYGIAYDERNDDYKVVGIVSLGKYDAEPEFKVEIYSLKNDSWKAIEDYGGGSPGSYSSPMIYANGNIHFLACIMRDDSSLAWDIVSLDVENEVYGTVEQPEYDFSSSHIFIGGFKGCISVLYSYGASDYVDVWVLKEYGVRESWTKTVRIPFFHGSPSWYLDSHNFCISSNGKILLGYGSYLVVYNPEDNSFVYPEIDDVGPMGIYVESLVPLPRKIP